MSWSFYIRFGQKKGFGRIKEAMSRLNLGYITIASGNVDIETLIENLSTRIDNLQNKLEDNVSFLEEIDSLQKKLDEANATIVCKTKEIKKLNNAVEILKDEVTSLESDLDDEGEEKENLLEDIDNILIYCGLK